jgi:hypothetical protein
MSIALSVILRPSRLLYILLGVMLLLANIGWTLGLSQIIQSPIWLGLLSVAGFLLSCIGFVRSIRQQKISQLDIDDDGRIIVRRLAQSESVFAKKGLNPSASDANIVWSATAELTEDSVVWSNIFVLHLSLATAQIEKFVILRDSIDPASFRRLGVALRWVMYDKKSVQIQENTDKQGNFTETF